MERSGPRCEHFCSTMVLDRRGNKRFLQIFFLCSLHLNLLCPISRSPISKLFRFSETLVKTNGKKWSEIWILLLNKGVFALLAGYFGIGATIRIGRKMICLPYAGLIYDQICCCLGNYGHGVSKVWCKWSKGKVCFWQLWIGKWNKKKHTDPLYIGPG